MGITKVTLVGANGHLGPSILQALLNTPEFQVSVLTRQSSKSTYASRITVLTTDDRLPHTQLVSALKGQDALVIAFAGTQKDNSIKLADAAFEAGVKHIIPADFGSCDSSDPKSLDLIPLYIKKKDVRDHIVELTKKIRSDGSTISWTSLITGHFFDYGLRSGLLSIDVEKGTARTFDGGKYKFAATTLADIGHATAKILQNVDNPRLKNRIVYLQSAQMDQSELVGVVEEVTGQKLKVENVKADEFIREYKARLEERPGDHDTTEELVCVGGIVNTNWDTKGDAYVNDLLDLPSRNLKEMVLDALN